MNKETERTTFPKYGMVFNGERIFLPFDSASALMASQLIVKIHRYVLMEDFSFRPITRKEREKIREAARLILGTMILSK